MRTKERRRPSWYALTLGAAAIALLIAAIVEIGPPASSARTVSEIVTAADGVVQSTVTGSGNLAPGAEDTLNFRTGGTLEAVYVKVGQHVTAGQLLAELDPSSAQLSLDQAEESLTAAEDNLSAAESAASSGSASATATALQGGVDQARELVVYRPSSSAPVGEEELAVRAPLNGPASTPSTRSPTKTGSTSSATGRSGGLSGNAGGGGSRSQTGGRSDSGAASGSGRGSPSAARPIESSGSGNARSTSSSGSASPGSIASDQAAVDSAEAGVASAEQTLADTRLYAPISGTVVSVASVSPGDSVSAGSSGGAAASSSGGVSSSGSSATGSLASGAGASSASTSSNSGGSSTSSGFIQLINTSQMTMTVALSESDIASVKVGQPATVSVDALTGVELAAMVSSISPVGTDSGGVVSYAVTLTLTQRNPQVKPGMSASASIITAQASGVTLPNAAVSGSGSLARVRLLSGGRASGHQVVVGLRGDTRTQIISGLKAGQQVMVTETLPALGTSGTAGSTSSSGTLGAGGFGGGGLRRLFGGGFGGGGFAGGTGAGG